MKQIFVTNVQDADVDLSYLKANGNIRLVHIDIKESPSFRDFINIGKIYRELSLEKIDVIHGHGAKGGVYARFLAFIFRVKCVYTPHGGSLHRVHGKIKNLVYDLLEKAMIPFTDIFLFESKYSAETFASNIRTPGQKTVINYNGVEIPKECSKHFYQKKNILRFASFGLLRHLKGHDIFIESCRILKEKGIPFTYTIYGNGDFYQELILLINRYNLSQEVKIVDYTGNVYQEMLKCDFVIHPSRFESFGYVPVEAMSIKIPVIVSHEGGLKEVVDSSSGYISYQNTPDSYVEIIQKIYEGDDELSKKIEKGYNRVRALFSKGKMIETIRQVYLR